MQNLNLKLGKYSWQIQLRDEADQSVYNEIFKLGEYRSAKTVIENAKNPIVDVGAHAGFFTLYCRALNEKVKIYAIEPEPGNLKLLKQHIDENNISGVKIIAGALGAETGKRELLLSADSHNHRLTDAISSESLFPDSTNTDKQKLIPVPTFSFVDFCKKNKINKISLLKIDIEGGEYELFESLSEADLSIVNFIILEYHYGNKYKNIIEKLRENGFGAQVFPSHFDKTMGFIWANNKRHSK